MIVRENRNLEVKVKRFIHLLKAGNSRKVTAIKIRQMFSCTRVQVQNTAIIAWPQSNNDKKGSFSLSGIPSSMRDCFFWAMVLFYDDASAAAFDGAPWVNENESNCFWIEWIDNELQSYTITFFITNSNNVIVATFAFTSRVLSNNMYKDHWMGNNDDNGNNAMSICIGHTA